MPSPPGRTARPPSPPEGDPEGARRRRSLEEPLEVRPRPGAPYVRWEVRNPAHGTRYLVLFPEFPSRDSAFCGCEDFARRGLGTCKHIEAAGRHATEHPEEAVARPGLFDGRPRWAAIDERLRSRPTEVLPEAIRDRRPGALLFEPLPTGRIPERSRHRADAREPRRPA